WIAPASLTDRVRLERLRIRPDDVSDVMLLSWQRSAQDRLPLVDAERLMSLILEVRLARGLIPDDELGTLEQAGRTNQPRRLVCNAHRAVPPLFVPLALGWLALGDAKEALGLLNDRLERSSLLALADGEVEAAKRAKLRVFRRMRMVGEGQGL